MAGVTRRGVLGVGVAAGAAACGAPPKAPPSTGSSAFLHGVASGDPLRDRVVVWTRLTPDQAGPVPVRWVVARDKGLRRVAASGEAVASAERDYCVKVDVGGLKPGRDYYYGFLAGSAQSPVGRTKTLPRGRLDKLVIASASCANYGFGLFNVYEEIARREEIDVVVHLGDYIYEYGVGGYGSDVGLRLGRAPEPGVETVSLADYRARHAQYKTDPDLQAAHAAHPWIVTWDDHEITNDAWLGGAQNHNPAAGEGDWAQRRRAAMQAYYEWMPIREPEAGRALEASHRAFQFGDLGTLVMLETRLQARTQQLDPATDLAYISSVWDFANPSRPVPVPAGSPAPATARAVPTPFDVTGPAPRAITEWSRIAAIDPKAPPAGVAFLPDVEPFKARLNDPARTLLGPAQERWVGEQLEASAAAKSVWAVLGNQVLMARIGLPARAALDPVTRAAIEKDFPRLRQAMALAERGVPPSLDMWNGYPRQRERLYSLLSEANANVVVLTGDSHTGWANELTAGTGAVVAHEFGVTSVTSPGIAEAFKDNRDLDMPALFKAGSREVKWHDPFSRGFLVLTLTRKDATAEFVAVSTILSKSYEARTVARFVVTPRAGAGVKPLVQL